MRDGSIDGAIVAFGVRNLASLDEGFREVLRVLRPGARFVILEFSTPPSTLVRGAYRAYSHYVLPAIGRVLSGHPTAYTYLPESVDAFPTRRISRIDACRGFPERPVATPHVGVAAIQLENADRMWQMWMSEGTPRLTTCHEHRVNRRAVCPTSDIRPPTSS
jgi:demethylmenaquinone methyltransferase/2-methoxy-6-polyprenyl-1,4-benzoquinol methylase